jgi:hypothetical protein
MHEEARFAATVSNTLDVRRNRPNRRVEKPNEDGRHLAGTVIPYARKFSATSCVQFGAVQRLAELGAENAELRNQAADLALAIMALRDI